MTVADFAEYLTYQEPSFAFGGAEFVISSPDGNFYVWSDTPSALDDMERVYVSVDDLLDNCAIQGRPLRSIVPLIDFG